MGLMKNLAYHKILLESLKPSQLEEIGYNKRNRKELREILRNLPESRNKTANKSKHKFN